MKDVSIIVPAYNAENTIRACLGGVVALEWPNALEIIVVDDGSSDRTADIARSFSGVRVISVENGGAAKATNVGIRAAKYNIVVSLDADAVLARDWLKQIVSSFDDPRVAGVAGFAMTGNTSIVGKIMGYDVMARLERAVSHTDHLYTMNTAYRRDMLVDVGMFDENLKVGYDVDISRRLVSKGYRLILKRSAICTHFWRDDLKGYLRQQYNYAYCRINIARKFKKVADKVAGRSMILQAPLMLVIALASLLLAYFSPWSLALLLLLPLLNIRRMTMLLWKYKDPSILFLPVLFILRNSAWMAALFAWLAREEYGSRLSLNKLRG